MAKLILCLIILAVPWFIAAINANYNGGQNNEN